MSKVIRSQNPVGLVYTEMILLFYIKTALLRYVLHASCTYFVKHWNCIQVSTAQ